MSNFPELRISSSTRRRLPRRRARCLTTPRGGGRCPRRPGGRVGGAAGSGGLGPAPPAALPASPARRGRPEEGRWRQRAGRGLENTDQAEDNTGPRRRRSPRGLSGAGRRRSTALAPHQTRRPRGCAAGSGQAGSPAAGRLAAAPSPLSPRGPRRSRCGGRGTAGRRGRRKTV